MGKAASIDEYTVLLTIYLEQRLLLPLQMYQMETHFGSYDCLHQSSFISFIKQCMDMLTLQKALAQAITTFQFSWSPK